MKAETAEWLRFANEDFAVGEELGKKFPRSALWSYGQAAEKYLKTVLTEHGVDFPKTHDCLVLVNLCPGAKDDDVVQACVKLAAYGPSRRYPGENLPIDASDLNEVQNAAAVVRAWCFDCLGDSTSSL